ncbi:MAG: DUF4249 domain-containing protein [Bacteroidia bacterium]|nr:DUF4249 domain-containing protein [Bacteroidia bacterium]
MKRLYIYILVLLCVFWQACEKDITVDLPKPDRSIVIEGAIESGRFPWITVTKNTPFFEPIDSAALMNMIVLNAFITVTDGIIKDTLHLMLDMNLVPPYKYVGSKIRGEALKKYSLYVRVDGKEYTATTTIPNPVILDSLRFRLRNPEANDSIGYLWIFFKDPDSLGNNYRIFTKTLGKDSVFVHPYGSVADDQLINGKRVEYTVYRGRNPNIQRNPDEEPNPHQAPNWAFITGEKAVIKFCSIDKEHFLFWKTVEQQMMSDGNPFSSPTTVITNIKGGALGIWGGYGVFLDTLKIPK